jgi:hypothetical protein
VASQPRQAGGWLAENSPLELQVMFRAIVIDPSPPCPHAHDVSDAVNDELRSIAPVKPGPRHRPKQVIPHIAIKAELDPAVFAVL